MAACGDRARVWKNSGWPAKLAVLPSCCTVIRVLPMINNTSRLLNAVSTALIPKVGGVCCVMSLLRKQLLSKRPVLFLLLHKPSEAQPWHHPERLRIRPLSPWPLLQLSGPLDTRLDILSGWRLDILSGTCEVLQLDVVAVEKLDQ